MPRRPLTPLQVELIERHRQRNSGRGKITATANQTPTIEGLDVTAIWAAWNAPRPVAQRSPREQAERELHREPQPALDAEEIYRRWNAPRQPAQQED